MASYLIDMLKDGMVDELESPWNTVVDRIIADHPKLFYDTIFYTLISLLAGLILWGMFRYEPEPDPLIGWVPPLRDDCPICLLPLPLQDPAGPCLTAYHNCCGSTFCMGCILKQTHVLVKDRREYSEMERMISTCPMCRTRFNSSDREESKVIDREQKLADARRHRSMYNIASCHFQGKHGMKQNKEKGLELLRSALEAGSADAAFALGLCYRRGHAVDEDHNKAVEYYHKAADLGHVQSFLHIGNVLLKEASSANTSLRARQLEKEAMINYRKAAMCGLKDEQLLNDLKFASKLKLITTGEYALTLRANQKARDEMESGEREAYLKFLREQKWFRNSFHPNYHF